MDRIINTPIRYRRETSFHLFFYFHRFKTKEKVQFFVSIIFENYSFINLNNFFSTNHVVLLLLYYWIISQINYSFSLNWNWNNWKEEKMNWSWCVSNFFPSYIKILSLSNKCWSPHFARLSIVTSETITIMKFLWERIYPKLLIQCFRPKTLEKSVHSINKRNREKSISPIDKPRSWNTFKN